MWPPVVTLSFPEQVDYPAGEALRFGWMDSPFGTCLLLEHDDAVAGLAFCDRNDEAALSDLTGGSAYGELHAADLSAWAPRLFGGQEKVSVSIPGTELQQQVWRALTDVPAGEVLSYTQLAERIGRPTAVRAVASAVAANPVAWLIPCHRIVRSSGEIGEYRWGGEIKAAMLSAEKT